jgi:alkanesulfonate monooxygenase SsuD/methylene tetrahydromethanopterin reductase-like flavin-dependent oxidoreductase (luciferase family)
MKYGLDVSIGGSYANPQLLADLAAEAEQAGWEGFFLWDGLWPDGREPATDPWIALAAMATQTQRLRIGTMVCAPARRRPWKLARETAALDHLSNGRLILGVGLGYSALDFETFGETADPKLRAEKLDEALQVLGGLWTGEPFSFHGKHYRVNQAHFLPKPLQQPRIPIWVGGYWPHRGPFRRAARWDGVRPAKVNEAPLTPDDLRAIIAYVQAHRASVEPFEVVMYGKTPADPKKGAKIVQPFREAGATWWVDGIGDYRGPYKKMKARIQSSPPKV